MIVTCIILICLPVSLLLLASRINITKVFCFWGRIWDLIVSVPDHCLSFYFSVIDEITYPRHHEEKKANENNQSFIT